MQALTWRVYQFLISESKDNHTLHTVYLIIFPQTDYRLLAAADRCQNY